MSGFAGVVHRDGAPVEPALLARMAERLAYRAADGISTWIDGPVGIVHGRFWTTPEEVGEEQPLGHPERGLRLAADLRLDNRAELLARLRPAPGLDGEPSDAAILLAAYRELGDRCCDEVLGDFAFALWDGDRRRLLLARDAMGIRQLYYTVLGSTIVFASTIGAVLAALPEPPPHNRSLIEAFLRDSYRHWVGETVYQGILRLPPGHLLVAGAEGARRRCWWQPGAAFAGSFSSDEEWAEGLHEVFAEAVRCRLRATTPVAVLAGGGVDSAAIACAAQAELGARAAERLRLVGMMFTTPSADESEYFDQLAGWLAGVEPRRIAAEHLPASLGFRRGDGHPLDEPEVYLYRSQTTALFGEAARSGCRVVLAGEGANQVLGHSFYYDPRALALVGWRELGVELPHFRAATGAGTAALLARAFVWPQIPAALQEGLRRLRGRGAREWVRPAGRGSWRRRRPPLALPTPVAGLQRAGRWAAQSLGRPHDLARYSAIDVTAAWEGVEWRLPFLDRRVADLLLHAPRRLRSWRGEDRRLLRRAMAGRMPEAIRRRRSKSHYQEVLDRLLRADQRAAVESLLDNPLSVCVDYVTASVTAAFDSYWGGEGDAFGLLSFLALESWLRERAEEGDPKVIER